MTRLANGPVRRRCGRIIRNKLWFYGGARRRTQRSNLACFQPNGEQCYGFDYQIFNTQKFSWQINASDRLVRHNYARKTTGQAALAFWPGNRVMANSCLHRSRRWNGSR